MRRAGAFRGVVALLASIGLLAALGVGPVSAEVLEDQVQEEWSELACLQPEEAVDCHTGLAQTLTVGETGQLTAVYLLLERTAETTAALTVEIRAVTPDGALLASAAVPAGDIPTDADWVLVEFPTMPAVSAGDVIAIVLLGGSDVGPPAPRWFWGFGEATSYAGGEALETGNIPPDWIHAPDWDAVFATYVAVGEPTCEIVAYDGDTQLTPPVEVAVGETFDFGFVDFPPFATIEMAFTPTGGDPLVDSYPADAFGESWWSWLAEADEVGDWVFSGSVVGTDCEGTLDVTILAAPAPTPTPAPTAAPTGTPAGVTLPPTSTAGETSPGGAPMLPALFVLGATVVGLVVTTRRFLPMPDRR